MTKKEILEQFEKMTPDQFDFYNGMESADKWLRENTAKHLYENSTYNEPMFDLSKDKIKVWLSQALTDYARSVVERSAEIGVIGVYRGQHFDYYKQTLSRAEEILTGEV